MPKRPKDQANAPEQLKAFSVRQPWAEQIMRGVKRIEYKTRPTKFRGRVYVYASLGRYSAYDEAQFGADVGYDLTDLPRGVVVGTVEITACIDNGSEYEWHLANPIRLSHPLAPIERAQPIWFHPFGTPKEK